MERPRYIPLIMHANEWQRLKNQAVPHEEPTTDDRESNYLKNLINQSQTWIKTWPDTVEGQVTKHKKQRKKKYDENTALINSIAKNIERESSIEAVKKARQLIFEDSCYGRRLISALLESKTIEERDIQIQFKEKIKQDNTGNNHSNLSPLLLFNIEENKAEIERRNKLCALDCARNNKYMNEMKKEKSTKEKELEKFSALEDVCLVEELLKREEQQKLEMIQSQNLAAKEYEEERIRSKELREKQRKQDEVLTELDQNRQVRLNSRMQHVLKEIRKDKQETPLSKKIFNIIEKCHKNENNRYQFVYEAIKKQEQRELLKEKGEVKTLSGKFEKQRSIAIYNKSVAEKEQEKKYNTDKKTACDRQSLSLIIGKNETKKKKIICNKYADTEPQLNFTPKTLLECLKEREKIPSPWNGTKAIHEQFAQQASAALRECRHKAALRKVIDGYRRLNNLDQTSLPIHEYY